jgi:hypothetical protein
MTMSKLYPVLIDGWWWRFALVNGKWYRLNRVGRVGARLRF